MLNNNQLSIILGVELPLLNLKDIHWRTQNSDLHSILFYKIGTDKKSEEDFQERIKNSFFGWLIVNRNVSGLPDNSTIVPETKWPEVQKKILDILYPMPQLK